MEKEPRILAGERHVDLRATHEDVGIIVHRGLFHFDMPCEGISIGGVIDHEDDIGVFVALEVGRLEGTINTAGVVAQPVVAWVRRAAPATWVWAKSNGPVGKRAFVHAGAQRTGLRAVTGYRVRRVVEHGPGVDILVEIFRPMPVRVTL